MTTTTDNVTSQLERIIDGVFAPLKNLWIQKDNNGHFITIVLNPESKHLEYHFYLVSKLRTIMVAWLVKVYQSDSPDDVVERVNIAKESFLSALAK